MQTADEVERTQSGLSLGRWPATIPLCFDRAAYPVPRPALLLGSTYVAERIPEAVMLATRDVFFILDHGTTISFITKGALSPAAQYNAAVFDVVCCFTHGHSALLDEVDAGIV